MNTIMTTYSILSLLLILLKVSVICISVDAFLLRTISVPVVYQSKFKRSRSTTCTGISFAYKQPELELECDEVTKTNIAYTVDRARNIAFNYDGPVEEFNPPEWFRNPHVQTIVGGLFRQQTMFYTGLDDALKAITSADDKSTFIEWDEQKRYTTPDGDFFDVDWKFAIGQRKGTVVLTHGLESGSSKPFPKDLGTAFYLRGFDVAYINFRGCSGESNLNPGAYHLSFTEDLQYFLEILATKSTGPVYLSGFSLGANVIANFLADNGENSFYKYNIHGAALNSCPMNVVNIAKNVSGGDAFSTSIYGNDLLRKLKSKCIGQLEQGFTLPYTLDDINKCKTVRELEDTAICPLYGFEDAIDYYEKSTVVNKLKNVCVPLYILNASDDPFFFGDETIEDNCDGTISVKYTQFGGHCGNIMHRPYRELRGNLQPSWMTNELANFIDYTQEQWKLQSQQ